MDVPKAKRDPRSREQLLAEIDKLRTGGVIEQVGQTARTLIRVGGVAFIAYMARDVLTEFAGRETSANILVNFLGSISVNVALAWGLAACGVIYGRQQQKLRKRTVSALAGRKSQLERQIDPSRSSSGLTKSGDTHPEDDDE